MFLFTTDYTDYFNLLFLMPMNTIELNQLSYNIIGCAYQVHKALGPGLLESTYETCLCYELEQKDYIMNDKKELTSITMA